MKDKSIWVIIILILIVSLTSTVLGAAPVTNTSTILPTEPGTSTNLQGYCNVTDTDGGIIQYEYKWFNGSNLFINKTIGWTQNSSLITGLTHASFNNPSFSITNFLGGIKAIVGLQNGNFLGFQYDGVNWTENTSLVNGLGDLGTRTSPVVYNDSGAMKLMIGNLSGTLIGFDWNGTKWINNNSITEGTTDVGNSGSPTIFFDGSLKLIVGAFDGTFSGFQHNGINWTENTSLVNGLGDVGVEAVPTVYNDQGVFKLISGNNTGEFYGFQYNGTNWTQDNRIIIGLKDIGVQSSPETFFYNEQRLISGEDLGNKAGYTLSNFIGTNANTNFNLNNISSSNTVLLDNWIFSCRGSDSSTFSSWLNSSSSLVTNRLNFTFFDSDTGSKLTPNNIDFKLIGDTAFNKTTTTANLYLENLTSDDYTMLFSSTGYEQSSYVITVDGDTNNNFSLYLQNDSASLVLLTVKDKFGQVVSGVKITIQKWVNNAWVTDQILLTDFQGRAEAHYILSNTFYNHILTFNGITYFGEINNDETKKLIYAEDVSNGINFNIDLLGGSTFPVYYSSILDVSYTLTFVNYTNTSGYFRYFFNDNNGIQRTGCLNVSYYNNQSLACTTCTTGSSATLYCYINQTVSSSRYIGVGSIDGVGVISNDRLFGDFSTSIDWGVSGYIFGFFMVLLGFFAFLSSPTIGLMVGTSVFVALGAFGVIFKDVSMAAFIGLLAIAFLIARVKSEGGLNG